MSYRHRRFTVIVALAFMSLGGVAFNILHSRPPLPIINGVVASLSAAEINQAVTAKPDTSLAGNILEALPVKGRAPKTGYKRTEFGNGWATMGDCDTRNQILARDLANVTFRSSTDCTVMTGVLQDDPYTAKTIDFRRGAETSSVVQIDHVVALSNAWQTGAQQLTADKRKQLANDPLELLAVDGPANNQKGDGDTATWLPSNKEYRCRYVARQIAVKKKYSLWVTEPERNAMRRVLATCPNQLTPAIQPVL
jgi:hypothetical protein